MSFSTFIQSNLLTVDINISAPKFQLYSFLPIIGFKYFYLYSRDFFCLVLIKKKLKVSFNCYETVGLLMSQTVAGFNESRQRAKIETDGGNAVKSFPFVAL